MEPGLAGIPACVRTILGKHFAVRPRPFKTYYESYCSLSRRVTRLAPIFIMETNYKMFENKWRSGLQSNTGNASCTHRSPKGSRTHDLPESNTGRNAFLRVFELRPLLHLFTLYPSHSFTYHLQLNVFVRTGNASLI